MVAQATRPALRVLVALAPRAQVLTVQVLRVPPMELEPLAPA